MKLEKKLNTNYYILDYIILYYIIANLCCLLESISPGRLLLQTWASAVAKTAKIGIDKTIIIYFYFCYFFSNCSFFLSRIITCRRGFNSFLALFLRKINTQGAARAPRPSRERPPKIPKFC